MKGLLTFILFFLLLPISFGGLPEKNYENDINYLNALILSYEESIYTPQSVDSLARLTAAVDDIKNNTHYRSLPGFEKLIRHYEKGRGYIYLNRSLSKCYGGEREELGRRFLNAAGRFNPDHFECYSVFRSSEIASREFFSSLDDISSMMTAKDVLAAASNDLLSQSVASYYDHRSRYGLGESNLSVENICKKNCPRCGKYCSKKFKESLNLKISENRNINSIKKYKSEELVIELNQLIEDINKNESNALQRVEYPPGSLLLSDVIQDEMGSLEINNDAPLKLVSKKTIEKAILEIDREHWLTIRDQARASLIKGKNGVNAQLKKIFISSPQLVGQNLIKNPEFSPHICRILADINAGDLKKENLYKWGGRIAMGALVVGTIATGGLLGAVVLGASSTITGALAITATAGVGFASALGGGMYAKKAIDNNNQVQDFERSILIGANDDETLSELKSELSDFYQNRMEAITQLGTSLIPIPALKYFKSIGELKSLNKFLKVLVTDSKLIKKLNMIKAKYGTESMRALFLYLAKMPFSKALEKLKSINLKELPAIFRKQQIAFWQKTEPLSYFFVKDKVGSRGTLSQTVDFFMDPASGVINPLLGKKELRLSTSIPIDIYVGSKIYDEIEDYKRESRRVLVKNEQDNIPGAYTYNEFFKVSAFSREETDKAILDHKKNIDKFLNETENALLAQPQILIENEVLKEEDLASLVNMAKYSLNKNKDFKVRQKKIKELVEINLLNAINSLIGIKLNRSMSDEEKNYYINLINKAFEKVDNITLEKSKKISELNKKIVNDSSLSDKDIERFTLKIKEIELEKLKLVREIILDDLMISMFGNDVERTDLPQDIKDDFELSEKYIRSSVPSFSELKNSAFASIDLSVQNDLFSLIEKNKKFSDYPRASKILLSQFFEPVIPIGSKTNVEIKIELQKVLKNPTSETNSVTGIKYQGAVALGNAAINKDINDTQLIQMAGELLENPFVIQDKLKKAEKILPKNKQYLGFMTDRPRKDLILELKKPAMKFNDELDKWSLLLRDKRLEILKDGWLKSEITDGVALKKLEEYIHMYNTLDIFSKKIHEKELTDDEAIFFCGLNADTGVKVALNLCRRIKGQVEKADISKLSTDEQKEKYLNCFKKGVPLIINYFDKEAGIAFSDDFSKERSTLLNDFEAKFSAALETCK